MILFFGERTLHPRVSINREELAWAGGFFEGEGWFCLKDDKYAQAGVCQINLEPLNRFDLAIGGLGRLYKDNKRDVTQYRLYGFEKVQAVSAMLWPWLSTWRKNQALAVLAKSKLVGPAMKDKTHCPQGHPYDMNNTIIHLDGSRHCRACNKQRCSERYYKKRNEQLAS